MELQATAESRTNQIDNPSPNAMKTLITCSVAVSQSRSEWSSDMKALRHSVEEHSLTCLVCQSDQQSSINEAGVAFKARIDQAFITSGSFDKIIFIGIGLAA